MFQTKFQKKSKHPFCVQQLFSENRTVYEILWKNMVQPFGQQITIQHRACALHVR